MRKINLTENPFFRHAFLQRQLANSLEPDKNQIISVRGICREPLDFIIREQLCDRALWAKFVEQYRIKSDTAKQEWRGEYWGKMMRGAAFVYSVTRDNELYAILEETVRDLLAAQDADGTFSTYMPKDQYNKWDLWSRKYILLGLLCFLNVCQNEQLKRRILNAAMRHADAILERVGDETNGKLQIEQTSTVASGHPVHGAMNSLSILEPMVLLYRVTGERRYLNFCTYLVEVGARACGNIFELAYVGRLAPYQYPYTKAYEMISCFEGLLEYALTVGNEKWKQAVIQFAYRMMDTDITLLGSAGTTHEFLDHASVHQTDESGEAVGQETCVSVTWMKFCARILLVTGDPIFGDCFEQTLYNAYLGTLNYDHISNPERIQKGFRIPGVEIKPTFLPFDSYTPLLGGTRGQGIGGSLMFGDGTYYGCCACIASVGVGIAPHLAVLRAKKGFSIQLYERGVYETVTDSGTKIRFNIETAYPAEGKIHIRVNPTAAERFTLSLRIPSWSVETGLSVNETSVAVTPGMTEIDRVWQPGDIVSLTLDMRVEALRPTAFGKDILRSRILWKTCEMIPFQVEEQETHSRYVAFRCGPLMLAGDTRIHGQTSKPLPWEERKDAYVETLDVPAVPFSTVQRINIDLKNGEKRTLIDCASAGRTWNDDSTFSVWMKTN